MTQDEKYERAVERDEILSRVEAEILLLIAQIRIREARKVARQRQLTRNRQR